MPWLAFLIELPTFAVIGWLFARVRPRRHALPALAGSLLLALAATGWAFAIADDRHGAIWPQVLAALAGYGTFLLAITLAWMIPVSAGRPKDAGRHRNLVDRSGS